MAGASGGLTGIAMQRVRKEVPLYVTNTLPPFDRFPMAPLTV